LAFAAPEDAKDKKSKKAFHEGKNNLSLPVECAHNMPGVSPKRSKAKRRPVLEIFSNTRSNQIFGAFGNFLPVRIRKFD
jgi:hypothetical protein